MGPVLAESDIDWLFGKESVLLDLDPHHFIWPRFKELYQHAHLGLICISGFVSNGDIEVFRVRDQTPRDRGQTNTYAMLSERVRQKLELPDKHFIVEVSTPMNIPSHQWFRQCQTRDIEPVSTRYEHGTELFSYRIKRERIA